MVNAKGVVYDLFGTIIISDAICLHQFEHRTGFDKVAEKQREKGWKLILFSDDEKLLVTQGLRRSKLENFFDEVHYGDEFDDEGLKNLTHINLKQYIFIGDMPRDFRAAEKYGANFVKVPCYTSKHDHFDFSIVHEFIDKLFSNKLPNFAKKHKLKKHKVLEYTDYVGNTMRLRVFPNRAVLQIQ